VKVKEINGVEEVKMDTLLLKSNQKKADIELAYLWVLPRECTSVWTREWINGMSHKDCNIIYVNNLIMT